MTSYLTPPRSIYPTALASSSTKTWHLRQAWWCLAANTTTMSSSSTQSNSLNKSERWKSKNQPLVCKKNCLQDPQILYATTSTVNTTRLHSVTRAEWPAIRHSSKAVTQRCWTHRICSSSGRAPVLTVLAKAWASSVETDRTQSYDLCRIESNGVRHSAQRSSTRCSHETR